MGSKYNAQMEDSEGNVYLMKPDIIDSNEALLANTKAGKVPDALLVKELNKSMGGVVLTAEGSGEDVKYFAQLGADAASKKQLGEPEIKTGQCTVTASNRQYTVKVDRLPKLVFAKGYEGGSTYRCGWWSGIEEVPKQPNNGHVLPKVTETEVVFQTVWNDPLQFDYAILFW